jgi:Electron transfer DM13
MKQILFILLTAVAISACKKSKTDETPVNDQVNPNATVLASGSFSGNMNYTVTGTAEFVNDNGIKKLVLKGFSTNSGPDLKVYIATSRTAGTFISLGNLKSTSGQQVYDISGMPDFAQYKFALIWCQQFSVLFGSAELK